MRGIRILGHIGVAFHTHPADTFAIAVEFYHRNINAQGPPKGYLEPVRPAQYWSDEHPLGITGLKRYSVVVADLSVATTFFGAFMGATVLYEEERPTVEARAVGLVLADSVIEFLTPTGVGDGEIGLARNGDGIRSTVFAVRDLERVRSYFAGRGITLRARVTPT